jgi:hypothetical protein
VSRHGQLSNIDRDINVTLRTKMQAECYSGRCGENREFLLGQGRVPNLSYRYFQHQAVHRTDTYLTLTG